MQLLFRAAFGSGYTPVVRPGLGGLELIEFGILNLSHGQTYREHPAGREMVGVILAGKIRVVFGDACWDGIGERADVFDGPATGFYLPPDTRVEIQGIGPASVALCFAPSSAESRPFLVAPRSVPVRRIGRLNWYREAHDIITERQGTGRLLVGETFSPPGHWSSYPPHRHEADNPPEETKLEEVYHFRVAPPAGFGVQRIYTDDGAIDETYTVRDRDTVAIPRGYHPVAAAAGYRLYYLWILAGRAAVLRPREDPAHAWINARKPRPGAHGGDA